MIGSNKVFDNKIIQNKPSMKTMTFCQTRNKIRLIILLHIQQICQLSYIFYNQKDFGKKTTTNQIIRSNIIYPLEYTRSYKIV